MDEENRELPAHIETMLSPRNVRLNQLSIEKILEFYRQKEARIFIDRGLAIQAASSGVPTSGLTTLLSLMFPLLLLFAPLAWYFFSWAFGLAVIFLSVTAFKASRALIVAKVREYALKNPKMLNLLISKGAIWFEHVEGAPSGSGPKKAPNFSNAMSSNRKESPSPVEQVFGTAGTAPSYFDLSSEHDGWHDILDSVVARLKPTISVFFPNEADGFVETKCELISYAAAYKAKLLSGAEIPRIVWNTFVSSVENRIFERIELAPNLSGYQEHADGSREFISYSSVYVIHMRDLERIVDRQHQGENYDFKELLSVFDPKKNLLTEDAVAKFSQVCKLAVCLCSDELIPTLEDFV